MIRPCTIMQFILYFHVNYNIGKMKAFLSVCVCCLGVYLQMAQVRGGCGRWWGEVE